MVMKLKNLKFSALILLSACIENAPLDSLSPEGPYARSIDELFWLTFWIAVVIFVIVQGALLLSVFVFKEAWIDINCGEVDSEEKYEELLQNQKYFDNDGIVDVFNKMYIKSLIKER